MPPADSLSTSRILRIGNLCPGMPAPLQKEPSHADSRITQRRPSPPSTGGSRSPVTGGRDQSEPPVAINRNSWSRSAGARNQAVLLRSNGVRHMSDTELLDKSKTEPVRRLEVFTGAGRRRSWTAGQKAQIVAESHAEGVTVCEVARRHA